MFSRRKFLHALASTSGAAALSPRFLRALATASPERQYPGQPSSAEEDVTAHVNIMIGTGGHGHTYPGATVPFGAVQLSPDTYTQGWDRCSGYHSDDASIMGFSHTHLSGTGCGDMLDVLLMPGVGTVKLNPGTRENPEEGYRSRFSHLDEHAEPGYYSVLLKDSGILAELTATERTGFHRYTIPESETAHFILDFEHSYKYPYSTVTNAELEVDGDMICGCRTVRSWISGRLICFAMQFSEPFERADLVADGVMQNVPTKKVSGKSLKAVLHCRSSERRQILVRCGISGVSIENAKENLRAELNHWDFDGTRAAAKKKWQKELGRVRIETNNAKQREIFYTSFYHMMVAPTLFDDVDGSYRGMDGNIHHLDAGQHNYSTFSLWDTYRALHPAFTLIQPERVPQFVNCLIHMAEESPAGMPVWPLQGKEANTMTGYHSASVIAEACAKGFPGIDWERAYKVMRKRNMEDNVLGLNLYREMGFIPADREEESVSKTLEYDYDDWACSHVADKVGAHQDAEIQRQRSTSYRRLFDAKSQFLRPKLADGQWAMPFDPIEMGHLKQYRDYTESNAWQATFAVQHDVKGYMELWGGRGPFLDKLDQLFLVSSVLPTDAPPDISGMVGQYAHGNEPSHHIAYLYVYAGQPWKTQARVQSLLDTMYDNQPDGVSGNEDCGQMSAWYFMSALGLYAVDPVGGNYVLTSPLFDKATLTVSQDRILTIEARRSSPDATFIQSIIINGKQSEKLWVSHREIAHGGSIVFILGDQPNTSLGTQEEAAPPSLSQRKMAAKGDRAKL